MTFHVRHVVANESWLRIEFCRVRSIKKLTFSRNQNGLVNEKDKSDENRAEVF
jgi:hypothetical protein